MPYRKNALQQETQHRLRLTREEKAIIDAHREANGNKEALRQKQVQGGMTRAKQRAEIAGEKRGVQEVPRGAIIGMDTDVVPADYIEGDLREYKIVEITSNRTGIIGDVHVPFHDVQRLPNGKFYGAYITAIEHLKEIGIETLLINGDYMDIFNLSAHEKLETKRNLAWELEVGRAMLRHLREFFGDKVRIIYKEGNHEERWTRYIAQKAEQFKGLLHLSEFLHLKQQGIEWIPERGRIAIGKLWVDHGHEWFGSGGINPAAAYLRKAGENIATNHVHKTDHASLTRPLGRTNIGAWTIGCLCDLNALYASRNNWNHGFASVDLDGRGFTMYNRRIINGEVR